MQAVAVPAATSTESPGRAARLAGVGALVVAAAAAVFAVLVQGAVSQHQLDSFELPVAWADGLTGVALAAAGAVVLARRRHALGWLMSFFGVFWSVDTACGAWLARATVADPPLPGASVSFWIYMRLGSWLLLILPLVLLLYPDGRLPSGRWRIAALTSLAATMVLPVLLLVVPSAAAELAAGDGPLPRAARSLELDPWSLPLSDGAWEALLAVAYVLTPLSLLVPFLVVVGRFRRAEGLRRTQLRWLLWAGVVDVLVMVTFGILPDAVSSYGLAVGIVVTAGSVAVGLTRPDLVDVERLLDSTLVYGALVVVSYLLDLLILGAAGRLLGTRLSEPEALVIAVFVVSLVYAPLRHRLWRLVRHSARGEREDPYGVVSRLAERLESSDTPADQLREIARAVRRAFRTSHAGVEILQADGGRLLVEHGPRPGHTDAMAISYRGEQIGWLHLPAGPRQRLRAADERLLADVVRQAAAAARAAQLSDELQSSRERLVTAVEDERRRLRNELHDGLGPTLAAVASRIDAARITGRRSPEEADRMLAVAREEVAGVIAEVRRLVHGLRPPALDDVGLAGAVRQQVDRLRAPGLDIEVAVDADLHDLPAAAEVAAYRIASEALTNVVRHARAGRCTVSVQADGDALVVEVLDDGVGISPSARAGVGLVSLRERARELGGRCDIEAAAGGGTRVRARLPLAGVDTGGRESLAKGGG